MPQTFQVLRCFQCSVFQVHPTKKANKWKCKMCGEKQSIKRFYGLGTGKECRLHVQKLNGILGEVHNSKFNSEDSDDVPQTPDSHEQSDPQGIIKKSKWVDYVDMVEEDNQLNPDNNHLNETEAVLELPKKRPRKSQPAINATSSFSNENNHLTSTRVDNYTKDKTVKSKFCNEETQNLCQKQLIDSHAKTEVHKKCVLTPTVSNFNSKWAQFVEETKSSDDEDPVGSSQNFQNDPQSIFSMFDEGNLDALLDF